jgi:DNA-binding beta-propeller fold protein YncE
VAVGTNPQAIAFDHRTQRVFVASWQPEGSLNEYGNEDGVVSVINAPTGKIVRTVTVGFMPMSLNASREQLRDTRRSTMVTGEDRHS